MPSSRAAALLALLASVTPNATDAQPSLLPAPRQAQFGPAVPIPRGLHLVAPAKSDAGAVRELADWLTERQVHVALAPDGRRFPVRFLDPDAPRARAAMRQHGVAFDHATMSAEGYLLLVDSLGADIIGDSPRGRLYGAMSLAQLVTDSGRRLFAATITDYPALRWRGFHDDMSRGPVPTAAFIRRQLRWAARFKLNLWSPYFEHTFEYKRDPLIAPPGAVTTQAEWRALVAYGDSLGITIVPEQEAFGHLHHVLKHEAYAPLGETPHGHVLAPGDPRSMPLLAGWFDELGQVFPSPMLHLGADETFELGRGRTIGDVKTRGIGPVYLDFLGRIVDSLRTIPHLKDRQYLFWGDIAQNHPDLVGKLPKGMIAVAWNYWSYGGFEKAITPFTQAGIETWVAPGVANWSRVYPNNDVALRNIHAFIGAGQRLGATGALNTNWDDDGEGLFNQVWLGVACGAAFSWQPFPADSAAQTARRAADIAQCTRAFARAFHGDESGLLVTAEEQLAESHRILSRAKVGDGGDYLFWLDPYSSEGQRTGELLRPHARALRVAAESALVSVLRLRQQGGARPEGSADALAAMELGARRLDLIGLKFQFADDIVRITAMARDTSLRDASGRKADWTDLADVTGINGRLQDLRDAYVLAHEQYERAWLAENRPAGLGNVGAKFANAAQLWAARDLKYLEFRARWARDRVALPPEEIGIPRALPGLLVP